MKSVYLQQMNCQGCYRFIKITLDKFTNILYYKQKREIVNGVTKIKLNKRGGFMLKDKKALEQYLDVQCGKIVFDNDKCKLVYVYANETYDIPKSIISDLISKRKSMSEVSEFVLFILLDSMNNALENTRIEGIDEFYTEQEVQYYRKSKYENSTIKFPIIFKAVEIDDSQWIGKIDIKTLMQLRAAQLINYNTNAQRTMQKVVKGDRESYKITLNHKAVREIAKGYEQNTFIPNTITLNMPVEIDPEFYYDEDSCSLVIKSLDHFDITDGYHRYIAACQVSDLNNDFNYNMELRIVNFTEDKAKNFIFQEDQKTKMRKVDSNSMNMNKSANIVVTRLNENIRCNFKGLISRNEGIISFGELAELVDYFYFKNATKEKERTISMQAVKELTDNFNMLTEYNFEYLERKMSYKTLLAAMFCFDYFKINNYDKSNICEVIEKTAEELAKSDNKKFQNKTPRKSLMIEVEKIVKGVM